MSTIADLLGDLEGFGQGGTRKDPGAKADPRQKFIDNCDGDIAALQSGEPHAGAFFQKRHPANGTGYVVTLRSGVKKIKLGRGLDHMICTSNEQAIAFLQKVRQLAADGELDQLFAEQSVRYAKF